MLFADLLPLHLATFWMFLYSCSCHFFSSRCMLELKFAINYRAASQEEEVEEPSLRSIYSWTMHCLSLRNAKVLPFLCLQCHNHQADKTPLFMLCKYYFILIGTKWQFFLRNGGVRINRVYLLQITCRMYLHHSENSSLSGGTATSSESKCRKYIYHIICELTSYQ